MFVLVCSEVAGAPASWCLDAGASSSRGPTFYCCVGSDRARQSGARSSWCCVGSDRAGKVGHVRVGAVSLGSSRAKWSSKLSLLKTAPEGTEASWTTIPSARLTEEAIMGSIIRRRSFTLRAAGAVLGISAALALAVSAAAAPSWPTHRCGSFRHWVPPEYGLAGFYYRITVLNRNVSCRTAMGLIRGFWSGKGVHHGGPSDAQSWWTLKAYAGWRCGQGAGAGSCTRRNSIAAYEVN